MTPMVEALRKAVQQSGFYEADLDNELAVLSAAIVVIAAQQEELVAAEACRKRLDEHREMTRRCGLRSTPRIVRSDGRVTWMKGEEPR